MPDLAKGNMMSPSTMVFFNAFHLEMPQVPQLAKGSRMSPTALVFFNTFHLEMPMLAEGSRKQGKP
jgi:hypothetical protein